VQFDDAVRLAIERNPTVASAATAIAQAEALLRQARAAVMPALNAGITNVTLDAARGFSGGITQPRNQSTFAASAVWPVLDASSWAEVARARDEVQVATLSSAESRRQIAVSAGQAYLAVIAAHRQVEVDERALGTARAHLDYAQQRLDAGAGSRLDQLRAGQEAAGDEARLENSRFALSQSQEALGVLLADPGPVDAGAEPAFDLPTTITDADWSSRPDFQVELASIRLADRVVRDAWKQWLPSAAVAFNPQYVTPSGLFSPSGTWVLTVQASQRIFDPAWGATKALKRIELDRAQLARTAVETQIRSEVRLAQVAVASYERALASAQRASDQAAEVLRVATSAFQLGATTNIEVIDAERTARDAASTATIAEDAARRARLDLLVALGRFPR
jgi:outer membrane protein